MAKRKLSETNNKSQNNKSTSSLPSPDFNPDWYAAIENNTIRFEREYNQEKLELPPEVKEIAIYEQWQSGSKQNVVASEFWQVQKPKKKQHWLDIGCGLSFLIYPWSEWDAFFYGQEISKTAQGILTSRAPQLNSKLFKGVKLGAAHLLAYEENQFDGAIATGWSCYYPLDYWVKVFTEIKRVLKPDGVLLFDVLDPDAPLAEDWAILETYLGTEVELTSLQDWKDCLKQLGGKVKKSVPGELFQCWKISFS